MEITINFFGKPKLFINETEIIISSEKMKAVLFYILYKGSVSRDELIHVFWSEFPEDNARSNLRNALSRLRSALDLDLITTPNNRSVVVNNDFLFRRDIDTLTDYRSTQILEFQSYIFLEELDPINTEEFVFFKETVQSTYEEIIINNLERQQDRELTISEDSRTIEIAEKILMLDPYNEKAYRNIMIYHAEQGNYHKALFEFKKLQQILNDDLGIEPEAETKRILESLSAIHGLQDEGQNEERIFRNGFITTLLTEYDNYRKGDEYNAIVFYGDFGTGKSTLINRFSDLIKSQCVVKKMDLDSNDLLVVMLEIAFMKDLELESSRERLIIIENLQTLRIQEMEEMLSEIRKMNSFIVFEYNNTVAIDFEGFRVLQCSKGVRLIEVGCLTDTEFIEIFQSPIKNNEKLEYKKSDLDELYMCTCGNFLLAKSAGMHSTVEKNTKQRIERVMNQLLFLLNDTEKFVLSMIACSYGGVGFDIFIQKYELKLDALANIVDKLSNRGLVVVHDNNKLPIIDLEYPILRPAFMKFFYPGVSTKFTYEILNYLDIDDKQTRSIKYYDRMIEMSEYCGSEFEFIKYNIKKLRYVLDFVDDFYPNIRYYRDVSNLEYVNKKDIYKTFDDLYERIDNTRSISKAKLIGLSAELYYLNGRSFIRDGYNDQGQYFIDKSILLMRDFEPAFVDNFLYMQCMLEKVYLGLRMEDADLMDLYLSRIKNENFLECYPDYKPVITRLEGYKYFTRKLYSESIKKYEESIERYKFGMDANNNIFGIAANHNYLAMCYSAMSSFDKSYQHHDTAINLCKSVGLEKPFGEFYKEYAYTAFLCEEYLMVRELCNISKIYYNKYGLHWERSVVDNLLSLVNLKEGNYPDALKNHHIAEAYSIKSPTKKEITIHALVEEGLKAYKNNRT